MLQRRFCLAVMACLIGFLAITVEAFKFGLHGGSFQRLIRHRGVSTQLHSTIEKPFCVNWNRSSGSAAGVGGGIKTNSVNTGSENDGTEGEKEFQKNLKLGVLFLNLGGPETIKVSGKIKSFFLV